MNETLLFLILLNVSKANLASCIQYSNLAINLLKENNFTAFGLCGYLRTGEYSWRYYMWVGVLDEKGNLFEYEPQNASLIRKTEYWSYGKGIIKQHWKYWQKDYRLPRICYFKRL
jgi:hypothetical protein